MWDNMAHLRNSASQGGFSNALWNIPASRPLTGRNPPLPLSEKSGEAPVWKPRLPLPPALLAPAGELAIFTAVQPETVDLNGEQILGKAAPTGEPLQSMNRFYSNSRTRSSSQKLNFAGSDSSPSA